MHTPGPWIVKGTSINAGGISIRQHVGPGAQCAQVQQAQQETLKANARLIAAAPEMLEALRNLSDLHKITVDIEKPESEWIESDYAFIPPFKNAIELIQRIDKAV